MCIYCHVGSFYVLTACENGSCTLVLKVSWTVGKDCYLFLDFFSRQVLDFLGGFLVLCFPVSLIFCVYASLLFLLLCFSCFSAFLLLCLLLSLLFCFSAFCFSCFFALLLLCFPCFFAFVLLCLSTSTILLFFSSVMCSCCSTSCSFASLLPVFTVSLFFMFFCFILFCLYPKWNPRETLGETQRNPKEILIRNPTWSPKWTLKKP